MNLRLSKTSDISDLKHIWDICFKESEPNIALKTFFDNKFCTENCVVCEVDDKIVSALHMLNSDIILKDSLCPSYYLYAAGTLPSYRGLGYMESLINYANELAFSNGKFFSVLLPENDSLYNYYGKLGYKKFFKNKIVTLKKKEMELYKSYSEPNILSIDKIYNLRFDLCSKKEGSVIWDRESIQYAFDINNLYNGKTVFVKEGYAICSIQDDDTLLITEFICSHLYFRNLMGTIYKNFSNYKSYKFRLPSFEEYFDNIGKISCFGMIKNLNKNICLNVEADPYLGLPLD